MAMLMPIPRSPDAGERRYLCTRALLAAAGRAVAERYVAVVVSRTTRA